MNDDRRRLRFAALLFILAIAAVANAIALGDDGDVSMARSRGVSIRYPADWRTAAEVMTPAAIDPVEVLVVATNAFRVGAARCNQFPENTVRDMSSTDALVWIAERISGETFDPLPARLPPPAMFENTSGSRACIPKKALTSWWLPFSRNGRSFYAYVVFGENASEHRQQEAWRMVQGLRVDPPPPRPTGR